MSITLQIPPELERRLAAESVRLDRPVESIAIQAIAEALSVQGDERQDSPEQWKQELRAWIQSHPPVAHPIDDSRANLYDDER